MTPEFTPSHHLSQMAIQAFAELLTGAQEGALNGDIPISVVRNLFSLQQSFFTSSQDLTQQKSLNEGDHPRARPIQAQVNRNAPTINGTVLIQKPVETLEAKLNQLLANQPKLEARQTSTQNAASRERAAGTEFQRSAPAALEKQATTNAVKLTQTTAKSQESSPRQQATLNTSAQKNTFQTPNQIQKGVLQELERQFDVAKTPELKAYLPVLLSVGQALTQTQDLVQMFLKHPMEKLASTEMQKAFAELKPMVKELKELMSLVSKNPSLLPKLEAHLQTLGKALQNISKQVTQILSQEKTQINPQTGLPQGRGAINTGQSLLQQHPALRELLTSLIVKGGTMPAGEAATVQQVATAKLPAAVIAPFTPQHRTENRNFKSAPKKPGPEPVWEDSHEEEADPHENCDEKEDEENETLS